MDLDWSALWLSLKVAGWATAINLVLGVALGALLARRRFPGRELLDSLLTLPMVLLAALTGAPEQATGAAGILLLANATLAHANVRMDTPVFNLFVTSSDQHRRHHSVVFEESNTNYACNAILWDRLFGTFSRGPVHQTGIGPTQPGLWRMFLLPFREPPDVDTVSTRARDAG